MTLVKSGRLADPATNAILVETAQLPAKERIFQVFLSSTVQIAAEIQQIAADGTTVLWNQILACGAYDFKAMPPLIMELNMAANEKLRVIAVVGVTGKVSCSIDYTP